MRGVPAVVIACVVVGATVACSNGKKNSASSTTTTVQAPIPAATTTNPTTTTVALPAACTSPSLDSLMLADVPSGYTRQPDAGADTGPTDLAKATRDDVDPTGATALKAAGFQCGYQRTWASGGGGLDANSVLLYKFATPQGAQQFVGHWRSELQLPSNGLTVTTFDPALPPPAYGVRGDYANTASTGAVVFAKGPYAVQTVVHGAAGADQTLPAIALANAQNARLPA
jgi:hypothetical protein